MNNCNHSWASNVRFNSVVVSCSSCGEEANGGYIAHLQSELTAAKAEIEKLQNKADNCEREAKQWRQEARTQSSTVAEIYEALTGKKGEPGDWNGAEPVRAEVERLRGRVAELEAGYTQLCNSASLARKILQDSARRDGVTDVKAHANWGHLDTAEHEDTITKSDARPWVMRKQAEAIDEMAEKVREGQESNPNVISAASIHEGLLGYAAQYRDRADELEKPGVES